MAGAAVGAVVSSVAGSVLGGGGDGDKAASQAANASKAQVQLAYDQWDYYKDKFGPVEQGLIDKVTSQPVKADLQGVSDRASADVIQAYDKAKRMTNRNLARIGINSSSGATEAANRALMLDQAKAEALAVNTARENERTRAEDVNFNRGMSVAGLGKGIPQQVSSGLGAGASGLRASAGMYGDATTAATRAIAPIANQAVAYGVNNYGLPATGQSVSSWGGNVTGGGFWDGNTGLSSGGTSYYDPANDFYSDGWADGGMIRKPGTPMQQDPMNGIADDVRIPASEGEYVVPADVVQRKGTEFFDKLLDKHHTPAAMQRAGVGIPMMNKKAGMM